MVSPVRVLYVHNSVLIGGGNRVLLGLFDRLSRDRFEPWSLLPGPGPMEEELRSRGIPCILQDVLGPAATGSLPSRLGATFSLALKARGKSFGLIHAQSPMSYQIPSRALKGARVRRLCHLHFPPTDVKKELAWAFRIKPHMVVACSRSVAEGYAPGLEAVCPGSRVKVLVNFADTEKFSPRARSPELARELGLDASSFVITLCGQVSERKGHPDFLRMAKKVIEQQPRVRFLIAGEDILTKGAYLKKMEDYARELGVAGNVSFLGFRSDVPRIVQSSDLILLPSYAEGMPLSLIEAAACAKPVIAYNIPGVDEVVLPGKTGELVPVGDVDALTRAVLGLLGDPARIASMGALGRKMVEDNFSLTAYVKRLEAIYDEALA